MSQSNLKLGKRDATIRGLEMLGFTWFPYLGKQRKFERYVNDMGRMWKVGTHGALRSADGLSMTNSKLHNMLQELGRWPNDLSLAEAQTVWRNMGIAYQQRDTTSKL